MRLFVHHRCTKICAQVDDDASPARVMRAFATLAGLGLPGSDWKVSGFLVGAGLQGHIVGDDLDLGFGMSYLQLSGFGAPVKAFNVLDLTVWHHSPVAYFFGTSLTSIDSQGKERFGGRFFVGVEFFHQSRVPLHVAVDVIHKFCDDNEYKQCPENEQAFWLAGRLGLRF